MMLIMTLTFFHRNTSGAAPSSKAPQLSAMEEEELRKQRKRFDDEMEAFQQILNYNADVAYGITPKGDK